MKLIKFSNGNYGIRRWFWPFYSYLDFDYYYHNHERSTAGFLFWSKNDPSFRDCQTGDEMKAREIYNRLCYNNKNKKVITDTVID